MPVTRSELARADDNSEIAYIISGTTSYDLVGPQLGSGIRNSTVTGEDIENFGNVGLVVTTDLTVVSGTPAIWTEIQGKDSTSGKYRTILSGGVLSTIGTEVLKVHPALTATTSSIAKDVLPRNYRIVVTHFSGATAGTYTVGLQPIIR